MLAWFTTWATLEVLVVKFVSPDVDRGDRVRADRQSAGAEGRHARAVERTGAERRRAVQEGDRTRRRPRARRDGGDRRRERHRLTEDAGVGPEMTVVVVLAWFTTWETTVEVLVVKFVSPQ